MCCADDIDDIDRNKSEICSYCVCVMCQLIKEISRNSSVRKQLPTQHCLVPEPGK